MATGVMIVGTFVLAIALALALLAVSAVMTGRRIREMNEAPVDRPFDGTSLRS